LVCFHTVKKKAKISKREEKNKQTIERDPIIEDPVNGIFLNNELDTV
jgi:hypothetical protein